MAAAALLFACGVIAAPLAQPLAQNRPSQSSKPQRQPHRNQTPTIGPEQAAQRARHKYGGRVLNVVLVHRQGGPYYLVKLLANGRVRIVDIDARR